MSASLCTYLGRSRDPRQGLARVSECLCNTLPSFDSTTAELTAAARIGASASQPSRVHDTHRTSPARSACFSEHVAISRASTCDEESQKRSQNVVREHRRVRTDAWLIYEVEAAARAISDARRGEDELRTMTHG